MNVLLVVEEMPSPKMKRFVKAAFAEKTTEPNNNKMPVVKQMKLFTLPFYLMPNRSKDGIRLVGNKLAIFLNIITE